MKFRTRFGFVALVCGALLALNGCGGESDGNTLPDPKVFFVNGSADSISLGFFLNETIEGPALNNLSASPDFREVEFIEEAEEAYDIAIGEPDASNIYDNEFRVLQRDSNTVVAAIGQKTFPIGDEEKRLQNLIFEVDRTAPGPGSVRLIIVQGFNRGPGIQTPAVDFQNPGENPLYEVRNLNFGATSTLDLDAGLQTFVIQRSDGQASYASVTQNLASGIYIALVSGVEDDPDPLRRPKITFIPVPAK